MKGICREGKMSCGKLYETGNSQPFNVMQPYVTTNYIIKAFQSVGAIANVVSF